MAFSGSKLFRILTADDPSAAYTGPVRAEYRLDAEYSDTSAKMIHFLDSPIGASATLPVNLQSLTDAFGDSISATGVYTMMIESSSSNAGAIHLTPGASNGWTGFLSDVSDIAIIEPGSRIVLDDTTGIEVSASSRVLNITNTVGTAATVSVLLVLKTS